MVDVFLKTLPFFLLIGTGWAAARGGMFPPVATAWLTRFVFYFALSAMLFRFAASVDVAALFDPQFLLAYTLGTLGVWAIAIAASRWRGERLADAAMEAHAAMIGNTGFLGIPMLVVLLGDAAIGPVMMVLTVDAVLFASLVTLVITGARQGGLRMSAVRPLLAGLLKNPMIMSMVAGLIFGAAHMTMPAPVDSYLEMLGAAATPGALFAIGASLAAQSADRLGPAAWVTFCKLGLHPAMICLTALVLFDVDAASAGVMIAAASLPVAGNVYILAQHFGAAERRVSTAILISTAISVLTIPLVIHAIGG